jgi:hypothetical protein
LEHLPSLNLCFTLLEKISAGMAEKARGGNFLLVLPYCKKFAMAGICHGGNLPWREFAMAEKYGFQLVNLLISEF